MAKFRFRLQRVLDYRIRLEDQAKKLYGDARNRRILADSVLTVLKEQWKQALQYSGQFSIENTMRLELFNQAMEDRIERQEMVISTLATEEEDMKKRWLDSRKERETLEKLKEKAQKEYEYTMNQLEQNALDEWAVIRKAAA